MVNARTISVAVAAMSVASTMAVPVPMEADVADLEARNIFTAALKGLKGLVHHKPHHVPNVDVQQQQSQQQRRWVGEDIALRSIYSDELEARDFEDELEARDFEDDLETRSLTDSELEARFFKGLRNKFKGMFKGKNSAPPTPTEGAPQDVQQRDFEDDLETRSFTDSELEARFFKGLRSKFKGMFKGKNSAPPTPTEGAPQDVQQRDFEDDLETRSFTDSELEARIFKGLRSKFKGMFKGKNSAPAPPTEGAPQDVQQRDFDDSESLYARYQLDDLE